MNDVKKELQEISRVILDAREKAYSETRGEPEPELTQPVNWPVQCTVGPGLEGAIACETEVGYVNGTKGWLIYRGYDIFELCAYSTFEEVSYLLLHGSLPKPKELRDFNEMLVEYRNLRETQRLLMSFPIESMSPMAALRLGTNLMRQKQTYRDDSSLEDDTSAIASDEDSIPMETKPLGTQTAQYEFWEHKYKRPRTANQDLIGSEGLESCYRLISGVASLAGTIARIRGGHLPLESKPELSHAANLLYLITGKIPTPLEEKIMDIALILHADHGMNASTFAAMVVASTLSDIYFSVGAGIAALNGPLHGGANEKVMEMLHSIGGEENVETWYLGKRKKKEKIMGFGHRVYRAYDPRARVLGPLAEHLVKDHPEMKPLYDTAKSLEKTVVNTLGNEKGIFPNVDFYSGFVYRSMGIPMDFFTPIFAVARVAGWSARLVEYLEKNRIFRPRAMYTGTFNKSYIPGDRRN